MDSFGNPTISGYTESSQPIYGPSYTAALGIVTEDYLYDPLNRLSSVTRDGTLVDTRVYDGADRLIQSGPANAIDRYYAQALYGTNANGTANPGSGTETHLNRFDDNGRLLFQRVWDAGSTGKTDTSYEGGYDAAGNLKSYSVFDYASSATNSYQMALDRRETYKQTSTSGSGTRSQPGASHSQYDVNGNLTAITDDTQPSNNRTLVNDISGKALQVSQSGNIQRQLVLGGEVLARYGVGIDELNPRDNSGNPNFAPISNSASSLTGILPGYVRSGADFNFGYQPINGNYPSASVGSYQVATGDTLQTIAQGAYGDSSLWYRIADANGLSGNADLRVGQTLSIPNRVGSVHNYGAKSAAGGTGSTGSFKPYDPSKVQGDSTPNLLPAPSDGGGCGGLGAIIVAIVVIVVAVVSQQYYLAEFAIAEGVTAAGAATYGAADLAIAGAIGGAAGSVAGQFAGNLVGIQDGFSWKGVALGAISGGVSGGLGGVDFTGGAMSNAIVRAAVGNALTQGIAVATGLQGKFSWKGVAAAAVGAGVGHGVGQALGADAPLPDGQQGPLRPAAFAQFGQAGQIARASLTGLAAGLSTAVARGGRVNAVQIATDAFGNALGSSWGEQINASVQEGKLAQAQLSQQENRLYSLDSSTGAGLGLRMGGGAGLTYGGARASGMVPLDNSFEGSAEAIVLPSFDKFEGNTVAGPGGAPSLLIKVGASATWKGHQTAIYGALDDLNAALSMGGQDATRLSELRTGALDTLNYRRIAMQTDPVLMQEVTQRGLTFKDDLTQIGTLGAFGDTDTVHRIAVATAQAGGVGRASAQGIAAQLSALEGFGSTFVNRLPGDASVEAAAPGVYLNTLLGMRSHVDSTMLYIASMSGDQMGQLGSYTDTVMKQGGMARYQDNEKLAGLFTGMQTTRAGMARMGEGFSVAGMGLRNFGASLGQSIGSMNPEMLANSTIGRMLSPMVGPMYAVPPGPSLKGGNNPAVQAAASRGSTLHSDKPGHLPDQLRDMYPDTTFSFTKSGVAGQDVRIVSGTHPSQYNGSTWPSGIDYADFKPGTIGGVRTFAADQRLKWAQPTHMLPYDPKTGLLK